MTCLLHVLLEDDDGSTLLALLEVRSGSRAAQQLREGHALLLLGARVSELGASHTWPSEAMRSAAPWVQQQSTQMPLGESGPMQLPAQQGTLGGGGHQHVGGLVLLWQESGQGCHLYDLSAIPGILNSPTMNEPRTLAAAVAALAHSSKGSEAIIVPQPMAHCPEAGGSSAAATVKDTPAVMAATCTVEVIGTDINTLRVHRCGAGDPLVWGVGGSA